MIQLQNVSMQYPAGGGVEHVNVAVRNGEFVFLVGPSGAGKSTVLKLIYMEEYPDEGHVIVQNFNSLYMRRRDIPYLRRRIGIVFQDFKLLPDRTIYDNIAFVLRVTDTRGKEIRRKVLRVLAEVGLSHKRGRMPHELSGGEQQRAAIARALVNEPFILLADEPTGNLDPDATYEIMDLLEKINLKGTAILMATHNYELVRSMRKRVIRIEVGRTL